MRKDKMAVVFVAVMAVGLTGSVTAKTSKVNCGKGDSLAAAVAKARSGDMIQVSGTCNEAVTITVDRITLDGGGTAIINGSGGGQAGSVTAGLLTVDGAQGVILTGLTVQNSPADGLLVEKGAAAIIQNTTVKDSADDGIQVSENATAQLVNCTAEGNGEFGIVVAFSSAARVFDGLVSQNNGSHGMLVTDAGEAIFTSGTVQFNNNGASGILAFTSSSVQISRAGPTVIANGNGREGISLAMKGQFLIQGGTLTATQNGSHGVRVAVDSLFVAGGTDVKVNLSGNGGSGINVLRGSQVQQNPPGEMTIQNNQASGIEADFGSIVNLLGGATVTDNGPADARADLSLTFGTMANVGDDNDVGVITCDDTVLLRGNTTVMCPTP